MHVQCSGCGAGYKIADDKIPMQGARVRCRKCSTVFAISRSAAPQVPAEIPVIPPTPEPEEQPTAPAPMDVDRSFGFDPESTFAHSAAAAPPAPPAPRVAPVASADAEAASSATAYPAAPAPAPGPASPTGIPGELSEAERAKHEKARRLARVLASDIAIYNKEKRDRGIKEGNLVAVLGYEIKKSWEVYKERVTADLANSTPYFRDALNEIVAEGKKIF